MTIAEFIILFAAINLVTISSSNALASDKRSSKEALCLSSTINAARGEIIKGTGVVKGTEIIKGPGMATSGAKSATANCVQSTATITCDCDGDGNDDNVSIVESCSEDPKSPKNITSRCEDWVLGDGSYGHSDDRFLSREGQKSLKSMTCPSLRCHQNFRTCTTWNSLEYQKCRTKNRISTLIRDCMAITTKGYDECKKAKDDCMSSLPRSGL